MQITRNDNVAATVVNNYLRRIWNEIRNTVWKPAIRRGINDEEGRLQRAIGSAGNSKSLGLVFDIII